MRIGLDPMEYVVLEKEYLLPIDIAKDVKQETMLQVTEMSMELPGVDIEIAPIRTYPMGSVASHVLGRLSAISKEELLEFEKLGYKYRPTAMVGRDGIEMAYQHQLSGTDGYKVVEVNAVNKIVRELDQFTVAPVQGDSVYLTIDSKIQKVALIKEPLA